MEASIPGVGTDSSGSSCGLFALELPQDMMICIAFEFADLLPGFPGGYQPGWMDAAWNSRSRNTVPG
jgi:hypothetical protein